MKILSLFLTFCLFSVLYAQNRTGLPKEYYDLHLIEAKDYFFKFFSKKIEFENKKILRDREFVLSLKGEKNLLKNSDKYRKLLSLQKKYKIQKFYDYKEYLLRIDVVPISMALAQAAAESSWGKSRFAKEANNIFGHWTYNPKVGMLPKKRPKGQKHLIKIFPNLKFSIIAYMRNLNTTQAYHEFRLKRTQMRNSNTPIDGYKLSETMTKYSAIGFDYVKILQSIIAVNKLEKYDIDFYNKEITKRELA